MLLITLGLKEHAVPKAALFSIVLNLFLAPITFDMMAHATGKIAYRRDLDIPWPALFPELLRFAFPVTCHLLVTWLAFASAQPSVGGHSVYHVAARRAYSDTLQANEQL